MRRFSQKIAGLRRKPQEPAENRRFAFLALGPLKCGPVPLVAKWLQTDKNYFRIVYRVTDTFFNYLRYLL